MSVATVSLGELMPPRKRILDPRKSPDKEFELFSIPAFDEGAPEVVSGKDVGSSKQMLESGDVLLSKIVPHIRRAWVVEPGSDRPTIGSSEWIIFRSDRFDPAYLRHALVSDRFHQAFMQTVAGVGGSLLRARPSYVAEIQIPLPSREEQRRIAGVLDASEALRAKRRQALDKLDSLTQAIFIDMFGDPVVNPMGWPVDVLTKLGDLDRGVSKHRPRNDPVLLGGGWPLIQTGDVAASNGYISEFSATYSDAGLAQSKIWQSGTLCITIAANIAKTGILTFDACFPDSIVGFRAGMDGAAEYTRCFLNFLQPALERQAPESAQKNINLKVLRELQVPIPPEASIAEFAKRAGEVNLLCQRGQRHQASLNTLFASLQQRAFRGEL